MAHELAHNMGVDHDGVGVNKDCDGVLRVPDFSINIKITKKFAKKFHHALISWNLRYQ